MLEKILSFIESNKEWILTVVGSISTAIIGGIIFQCTKIIASHKLNKIRIKELEARDKLRESQIQEITERLDEQAEFDIKLANSIAKTTYNAKAKKELADISESRHRLKSNDQTQEVITSIPIKRKAKKRGG